MSAQPPGRIPFEDIAAAKSWLLPEVNGNVINRDEQRKRQTQAGKNKAQQSRRSAPESPVHSEDVEPPEPKQVKGITAQQLEEITQAAEQDGFDKGYAEGLEQGKLDGRKAGYSEGLKAGTEQAESEHGQWLKEQGAHMQSLCEALMAPLECQQKELSEAVLDLAMGLARRLLQQELASEPQKIIAIVDRALEALPPVEKNIALYLHPDDAQAYREFAPHTIPPDAVHEDENLERGSCKVKSQHSYLDYSVASRLDEFASALLEQPFEPAAAEAPIPAFERENVAAPSDGELSNTPESRAADDSEAAAPEVGSSDVAKSELETPALATQKAGGGEPNAPEPSQQNPSASTNEPTEPAPSDGGEDTASAKPRSGNDADRETSVDEESKHD
ncbi:MAG TPA: flagellar assembly protein FliH [Marinagarivorans sp.]